MIGCAVVADAAGSVLLVQEAKASHRGQWNLPGGHVEHGETPVAAVIRELREETNLRCDVAGMLGMYCGPTSIRFAFQMTSSEQKPIAGDEILAVRYFSLNEIAELDDAELVRPATLRSIIASMDATDLIDPIIFRSITEPLLPAVSGMLR